ncbi:MAG: hypothetical protein E7544_08610 [Ruminococcaceae bacterium]|nr:hypothetical protein [Oscillospiraceae bacterium]
MSYAKTVFFIPVWFDNFKKFTDKMDKSSIWNCTEKEKISPSYLFHYATNIAKDSDLFKSYSLKNLSTLNVYMYGEEVAFEEAPSIEEVRFSCFSTGVGFIEFWVSYRETSLEKIANFSYLFKKATKTSEKALEYNRKPLCDVAKALLPDGTDCRLFFSSSAEFKYECNCFHFVHRDCSVPGNEELADSLHRLCRSYKSTMPIAGESTYDVIYEAGTADYWCGSTEGLANVLYDFESGNDGSSDYYLHTIKPIHLNVDYYFLYLLLLNQKYSAIQYIYMVSRVINKPSKDIENLNRRIIQLKNVFSFNIISDDMHFQNIYSKMFSILEIKNLLADVIENENQIEYLQRSKHANDDRMSNKYLFGISMLSLFSALIDAACYFDRIETIRPISTFLSLVSVSLVLALCVAWGFNSIKK